MVSVRPLAAINKNQIHKTDRPKNIKISKHTAILYIPGSGCFKIVLSKLDLSLLSLALRAKLIRKRFITDTISNRNQGQIKSILKSLPHLVPC